MSGSGYDKIQIKALILNNGGTVLLKITSFKTNNVWIECCTNMRWCNNACLNTSFNLIVNNIPIVTTPIQPPLLRSGRPLSLEVNAQNIFNDTATAPFTFIVSPNVPPGVAQPLFNQEANVNEYFTFPVPTNTFSPFSGDTLYYNASLLGGSALLPHVIDINKLKIFADEQIALAKQVLDGS